MRCSSSIQQRHLGCWHSAVGLWRELAAWGSGLGHPDRRLLEMVRAIMRRETHTSSGAWVICAGGSATRLARHRGAVSYPRDCASLPFRASMSAFMPNSCWC